MDTLSVLILAFTLVAVANAQAQTCPIERNVISVTGAATRSVTSTIAVVSLAVRREGKTAAEVQKALATGSASLLDYLRKENVTNLETSGVALTPTRDYSKDPATIVGYSGRRAVTFETTVDRAGPILDGAVTAGATEINSVSFKGTAEATLAARKEAINDAVESAKAEANEAAMAVGKTLGEAINVKIVDRFRAEPVPSERRTLMKSFSPPQGAAVPSEIVGKDVDIAASITVIYEMK